MLGMDAGGCDAIPDRHIRTETHKTMKNLPRIRVTGLRCVANRILLGVVAVCGIAPAGAETGVGDGWQVVVAPYLWAQSLDGNAQVGALEADVDAPSSASQPCIDFRKIGGVHVRMVTWSITRREALGLWRLVQGTDCLET